MTSREKLAAYGAWAAVCFLWGTTYLGIRIGLETLSPMLLAGIRFTIAGAVLFIVAKLIKGARLPKGREWLDQAFIGLLLLGIGNGMVVVAELWVSSGAAALLVGTAPFWVVGMERMFSGGERPGGRALAGMLLGFVGLALLVGPELFGVRVDRYYLLGVLAIQIGCLAWTAGSIYSKRRHSKLPALMAASIQMLIAGVALTIIGTALGDWNNLHFSARSLAALSYLIVFGSIVAFGSYTYAIEKLPLSFVSMYSYINPVIAVLLGWSILSEPLGWRVIGSMAVILMGVALVKAAPMRRIAAAKMKAPIEADDDTLSPAPTTCTVGTT